MATDGGIFAFNAPFFGSTGNIHLNRPIVGMSGDQSGHGYWMVASDGGIFAFGDAPFLGSTGNIHLNMPVVGMAVDPATGGYWLVASDGGIFSFGNAPFLGSTGNIHLNKPIVGMSPLADGSGYRLIASDGGVFAFNAAFFGSTGNIHLNRPDRRRAGRPGHRRLLADRLRRRGLLVQRAVPGLGRLTERLGPLLPRCPRWRSAAGPGPRAQPVARIRLLRASWVTSARPRASSRGGRYIPKRPR